MSEKTNSQIRSYLLDKFCEQHVEPLLQDSYDLIYVSYDDRWTDEQVSLLLRENMDDFWYTTAGWVGESTWEGANYEWEQISSKIEQAYEDSPWYFQYAVDMDYIRDVVVEIIRERESGSWFRELMDNTSTLFLAIPQPPASSNWVEDRTEYNDMSDGFWETIQRQFKEIGFDLSEDQCRELASESEDQYCVPMVGFQASASFLNYPREIETVEVEGDMVLWYGNTWEGVGSLLSYTGEATFNIRDVAVDSEACWGMDDVFGLSPLREVSVTAHGKSDA